MVARWKWIAYSTQLDPKLFQYATKHIAVSTGFRRRRESAHARPRPAWRQILTSRLTASSVYFIADDDGTKCFAKPIWRTAKISVPSLAVILYAYSGCKIRRHCRADSNRGTP